MENHAEPEVLETEAQVVVTKDGTVLTDEDMQRLADEAERGYDVARLKPRPRR